VSEKDPDVAAVLAVHDFSSSLISFRDKDRPVPSYLQHTHVATIRPFPITLFYYVTAK